MERGRDAKARLSSHGNRNRPRRRLTILFDGQRCIHSRNCVLDRPDVFVPNVEGEWIHPDRASVAEVAALARNCPSGAIRYETAAGFRSGE